MSTIDGVMLRAVREELNLLVGARVQDIRDAEPHGLMFELYRPRAGLAYLLASAGSPGRVHLVAAPPANAGRASAAGRLFRQRLLGARLLGAEMRGLERVLVLVFARRRPPAGGGDRPEVEAEAPEPTEAFRVFCEATGRAGNVVLVDEKGLVVEALRRVPTGAGEGGGSREGPGRAVWPGFPYAWPAPPPGAPEVDLLALGDAELCEFLARRAEASLQGGERAEADASLARFVVHLVPGVGPALAREAALAAGLDPDGPPAVLSAPVPRRALCARLAALLADVRAGRFSPSRIVAARDGEKGEGAAHRTLRYAAFPLTPGPGESRESFASPSALLEVVFAEASRRAAQASRLGHLRKALREELERVERRLGRQEEEWQAALAADELRHEGELILANAHAIPRGTGWVDVPDWAQGGRPRRIALDPRRSPAENAKERFARYRKARRRRDELAPWLDRSRKELARLRAWLAWAEAADPEDPESEGRAAAIAAELAGQSRAARSSADGERAPGGATRAAVGRTGALGRGGRQARGARTAPAGGRPAREVGGGSPRRYLSSDGWTLLAGRNRRQNEWLSLRHGRPDDWWFHVKDAAGTHVLARAPQGWPADLPPPEATLREAALLAAFFSEARAGSNVPVDYTRCRYVRRLRGAGPGQVAYDHQRTTFVTPRPEALPAPAAPPDAERG